VHAHGAAFDNPDLLVCCVVGDGEAETGPLAASWHSNKFLNAARDGAVLPILHLNGYKIANPTVLARIPEHELRSLLEGYGYAPWFVEGSAPEAMHQLMAATLDQIAAEIAAIQARARAGDPSRPAWPMIVLRTPKGWTGPKTVDGLPAEGSYRSHQVPLANLATNPEHLAQLEAWMRSYRPEELFDADGALRPELAAEAPGGERRMGSNPHANGGLLTRDLMLPDFRHHAVAVPAPAHTSSEATRVLGGFLRDVMRANETHGNFRLFGPDETASNRLGAVFEATDRVWEAEILPTDDHLAPDGRVMEVLSEHLCQGWLEGYLLTGRHGLFSCYEAFIHRREPHRRVHGAPVLDRRERRAGTEVAGDDPEAALPDQLVDASGDVSVRETVKPVPTETMALDPVRWEGVLRRGSRQSGVERGVEAGDGGEGRARGADRRDALQRPILMERRERSQFADAHLDVRIDPHRTGVPRASVNHAVPSCVGVREPGHRPRHRTPLHPPVGQADVAALQDGERPIEHAQLERARARIDNEDAHVRGLARPAAFHVVEDDDRSGVVVFAGGRPKAGSPLRCRCTRLTAQKMTHAVISGAPSPSPPSVPAPAL
jgi:hypothetical protein